MQNKSFIFNQLIRLWLAAAIGSVLAPGIVLASDYHSPRTAALGGAGHGGPLLNDAIFLNPSFEAFLPTYSVALNILKFSGPPPPGIADYHGRDYSVSLQDGRQDLFQAGVAYTQLEQGSFIHLGAAKAIIKRLGFGLGGKFFYNSANHSSVKDGTFSVTGAIADPFQASVIIDNLFESADGKAIGLYREYILGTKTNVMGIVLLYFDPHWLPSLPEGQRFGHEVGLEFVLASDFFLRLGNFRNAKVPFEGSYGRGYGAGVGWIAPRLSIDYAIQRAVEPLAATAHTLGFTAYF